MKNYNKLDTAAKLFPAVSNKHNSSVFRVAVVLNEPVDAKILQLAANMIYERYSFFFMKLKKGFFWNYFDENLLNFRIEKEEDVPCSNIVSFENKDHYIKVLYYGNRISVEAFHSITDGSGASEYIKSLVYYYLCIKHGNVPSEGKVLLFDDLEKNDEDSFTDYFHNVKINKNNIKLRNKNSLRIKGDKFKKGGHNVVTLNLSIKSVKEYCKKKKCTITVFLVALMINTIHETYQNKDNKPIVIAVPVNLRKIFPSKTLKNFFGVINISYEVKQKDSLENIIKYVAKEFNEVLTKEKLESSIHENIHLSNNIFTKHTPLLIKNFVIPVGFNFMGELKKTITISNIGQFEFPTELEQYISHTEVLLYPTKKSPINCGICSCKETLSINFIRSIKDNKIVKNYATNIKKIIKSELTVYSNNWGEKNEKM